MYSFDLAVRALRAIKNSATGMESQCKIFCYTHHFRMATVRFTQNIQRHVECPTREAYGATLRAVLDDYFDENERARGYVLDEQGRIRQHMVIFIDGELVRDRDRLSDPVEPKSVIDVIQALSGG